MKKICILLLCILSAIFPKTVFAEETTVDISVGKITASEGETVDVPVNLKNNTGICGAILYITYNDSLKLNYIKGGNSLSTLTMTQSADLKSNPIKLVWDGTEEDKSDGDIAILNFDVPKTKGIYDVSVSYIEGDIVNGKLEAVNPKCDNGYIEIENGNSSGGETGDITGGDPGDKPSNENDIYVTKMIGEYTVKYTPVVEYNALAHVNKGAKLTKTKVDDINIILYNPAGEIVDPSTYTIAFKNNINTLAKNNKQPMFTIKLKGKIDNSLKQVFKNAQIPFSIEATDIELTNAKAQSVKCNNKGVWKIKGLCYYNATGKKVTLKEANAKGMGDYRIIDVTDDSIIVEGIMNYTGTLTIKK